jgi:small subunit ribosomal protein S18
MAEEKETTQTPAADVKSAKPVRRFRRYERRRKVCRLCENKIDKIDYKNIQMLRSFTMESGKILSRRITGTCAKHQRQITKAVKRNRNLAALPYTNR